MILLPLLASISLQIFASTHASQLKLASISDARSKAKQDHSDDGNPVQ